MALKDGDYIETLDVNFMPSKDNRRRDGWMIYECGADDIVKDALKGRTDGVHSIAGRYNEFYSEYYYGEWDCDFWVDPMKVRYRGPLAAAPSSAAPQPDQEKPGGVNKI